MPGDKTAIWEDVTDGLDAYFIILCRVEVPDLGNQTRQEKTHEASNQDINPDVWTSGHVCGSRRSAGPHPGRRAHSTVPTTTTTASAL